MIILLPLIAYLGGQFLEVGHNERVNYFDVLVILGRQVVLHQADLLSQQIDLLFVVTHLGLRLGYNAGDEQDLCLDIVLVCGSQTGW